MSKKRNKRNTKKFKKQLKKRTNSTKTFKVFNGYIIPETSPSLKSYLEKVRTKSTPNLIKSRKSKLLTDSDLSKTKISNGYDDLELYHITPSYNVPKIEKSGGLRGNKTPNPHHNLSEFGCVYSTINNDKSNMDDIVNNQILDELGVKNAFGLSKVNRDYTVFKINGKSLKKRGIQIKEDFNESINNHSGSFQFELGKDIIPLSELEKVGEYKTEDSGETIMEIQNWKRCAA